MKSFIKKILTFILIYLIITAIVSQFVPRHWGNPWYSTKIQYLENQNHTTYNSFFFGSSRVYRQIDPFIIDNTLNGLSNNKFRSFNLGAPSTFCPQSYYLYEDFLSSRLADQTKLCVMELGNLSLGSKAVMHQERSTYWLSFNELVFVVKSILKNNKLTPGTKVRALYYYGISYLESTLHFGHYGQQMVTENYYKDKYLGPYLTGYNSLEIDLAGSNTKSVGDNLRDRYNSIRKNPNLLRKRKADVLKTYQNPGKEFDTIHLERIIQMIKKSEQKGIRLIFLVYPKLVNDQLLNLSRQIPEANLINMGDPVKYEAFYELDYSFDVGHLNTKGSNEFSKLVAIELNKKINQ